MPGEQTPPLDDVREDNIGRDEWKLASELQRGAPAADQLDQQHHNGQHEQDVNVRADGVKTHQAYKPEHEQNDKDSPQHGLILLAALTASTIE